MADTTGEVWTIHETDRDGILRMVLVQERFRGVVDYETGEVGEVVNVLPVRTVEIDEDWHGPPCLIASQEPGEVVTLADGVLEVAPEWKYPLPVSMLRRRIWRPADTQPVVCPSPHCEGGLIRGTSVGCAVCQPTRQRKVGWMGLLPGEEP